MNAFGAGFALIALHSRHFVVFPELRPVRGNISTELFTGCSDIHPLPRLLTI